MLITGLLTEEASTISLCWTNLSVFYDTFEVFELWTALHNMDKAA